MGSGEGSAASSGGGSVVGSGEGSVLGSGEGSGVGSREGLGVGSGEGLGVGSREGSGVGSGPVASLSPQLVDPDDMVYKLCHLNRDQLHILWHQCLGHLHSCHVSNLHKFAQGVPSVPVATDLDSCPVCTHAALCRRVSEVKERKIFNEQEM